MCCPPNENKDSSRKKRQEENYDENYDDYYYYEYQCGDQDGFHFDDQKVFNICKADGGNTKNPNEIEFYYYNPFIKDYEYLNSYEEGGFNASFQNYFNLKSLNNFPIFLKNKIN